MIKQKLLQTIRATFCDKRKKQAFRTSLSAHPKSRFLTKGTPILVAKKRFYKVANSNFQTYNICIEK